MTSNSSEALANNNREIKLEAGWRDALANEFASDYMQQLRQFLLQQKASGKRVFPAGHEIFNALNTTAFDDVKVVVLGQDPYHGPGQAHGKDPVQAQQP